MLFPALTAARESGRRNLAKVNVRQLDMVFKAVLLDFRSWGKAGLNTSPGGTPMSKTMVEYLRGDVATGKARYMEFDKNSLDSAENFIDPWSTKTFSQIYQVALGDSTVKPLNVPADLPRQVAAWSWGKKGQTAAQVSDYIKSWE
jgi:hypothetical protein